MRYFSWGRRSDPDPARDSTPKAKASRLAEPPGRGIHHSAVVISLIVVVLDTEHLEPVNRTDLTGLHTLDSNFQFDSNHRNHGLTLLRTVQKRWLCCCTNLLTIHKPLWPASYCYALHGTAACQITLRRLFFQVSFVFAFRRFFVDRLSFWGSNPRLISYALQC